MRYKVNKREESRDGREGNEGRRNCFKIPLVFPSQPSRSSRDTFGALKFLWRELVCVRKFLPVKLSVKSDYATRAVLWLGRHHHEGVARKVEEMASAQGIPPNYLVQILIELKSKQIVKSQRGKEGGYL